MNKYTYFFKREKREKKKEKRKKKKEKGKSRGGPTTGHVIGDTWCRCSI
jgi:hypothetical protein